MDGFSSFIFRKLFSLESSFHFSYVVEFLPCEKFHLDGFSFTIRPCEGLCYHFILSAHVSICSCLAVYRIAELKTLLDEVWTHVKYTFYYFRYLSISQFHFSCTESIDEYTHRLCYTDSIRETCTSTSSAMPAATRFLAM